MLVDGITPPGRRILAHDRITQEGWSSALTAAAIPDANGALSVPLASGLPAPMADNDAIRMRRLETAALAIVAGTPHSSGRLHLDVGNAALAQRLAAFARCDRYGGGAPGDLRLVGPSGERFDGNLVALDIHEDDAEVLVARYAAYGAGAEYPPIVALGTNVQVVSAHRLRIYTADHTMTGTLLFDFVRHGGGVNLPEWLWHPGGGSVLRFIGTIVGGGVFAGAPYHRGGSDRCAGRARFRGTDGRGRGCAAVRWRGPVDRQRAAHLRLRRRVGRKLCAHVAARDAHDARERSP